MGESMTTALHKNRSVEEIAMRELVVERLRGKYPGARIIHELPLRYSQRRIDLAAVTETDIISVEIKSSRDVIDRLEEQIRAFLPISSKVIVALAPKWNPKPEVVWEKTTRGEVGTYSYSEAQQIIRRFDVETWTVCADSGIVEATDGMWLGLQRPWAIRMLDILWREELLQVAVAHGIGVRKDAPHAEIRDACEENMTGREVRQAVCKMLRQRQAFDKASDAAEDAA